MQNNIKNTLIKLAGAIGLVTAFTTGAQAASITGNINFGGALSLTGGSSFATTTGIDFGAASVLSGSGDFSGVPAPFATSVSFTDFSFASFPVGGVTPLWSFSAGGNSYSFELKTLSIDKHDATHLNLSGTGLLSMTGFDPTNALWKLSTQSSSGKLVKLSFSADNTAAVPLPGALVFFASGIIGLVSKRLLIRK